jgi:hypothetical protein
MDYIKLTRIYEHGHYGVTRGNGNGKLLFSAGITDPLCGWEWLLNRDHPLVELEMSVSGPGYSNSFRINPRNPDSEKIVKEVCSVALRRR